VVLSKVPVAFTPEPATGLMVILATPLMLLSISPVWVVLPPSKLDIYIVYPPLLAALVTALCQVSTPRSAGLQFALVQLYVPIDKSLHPLWQALPEYPLGHTQTLLAQLPPFWQVVLPHLFLQLLNKPKQNTPTVSSAVNKLSRNDFKIILVK
jgi:hypothetical protein